MRNSFLNNLIGKLKGGRYEGNYQYSFRETFSILYGKLIPLLRGFFFYKFFLRSSRGFIFVEKGVKVKFKRKINCGKNLYLKRYSEINALSFGGISIGDNFTLGEFAIIECTGVLREVGDSLVIGDNVGINHFCFISVRGKIIIGDNVIFGPRVNVFSENHNFNSREIPIKEQGTARSQTIIESDVWLGSNSTILAGVKIGKGSIIAAGAVVDNDVEPYTIVGGIPAKKLRDRPN